MLELLERKAVEWKKHPVDELDEKLRTEAEKLLGYKGPADIGKAKEKFEKQVKEVFDGLGLRPFTRASVEAYKTKAAWSGWSKKHGWQAAACGIAGAAGIAGFATSIALDHWAIVPLLPVSAILIAGAIANAKRFVGPTWQWRIAALGGGWNDVYTGRVPEFALQTAVDLKKACNKAGMKADFYVEFMQEKALRHPDPFLAVVVSDEFAPTRLRTDLLYIEVWNEPKYKQEREV